MSEKVEIPYGYSFSFSICFAIVAGIFFLTRPLIRPSFYDDNYDIWLACLIADLVLSGFFILLLKDYILPALKKKPAVILTIDGITDNTQGFEIFWKDVRDIEFIEDRGKGGECVVRFQLRDGFEYRQFRRTFLYNISTSNSDFPLMTCYDLFPLTIAGSDEDVYRTIRQYFESVNIRR